MPNPLPSDYNDAVFRQGQEAHALDHSILLPEYRDVHPLIADRIAASAASLVLDLGCGPTKLGKLLDERGVKWVGIDAAVRRLEAGHGPRILGDARHLPFPDGAFGAVAALYMLYHLADPVVAIREAHRVIEPGGLFAATAPSRYDDPELSSLLPGQPLTTFDSELAPALIGQLFEIERVDAWEMALYRFPDGNSLWSYLVARGMESSAALQAATRAVFPLWVTKRGATVWGRKRP